MVRNNKISSWVEDQLAQGNYSFTAKHLKKDKSHKTDISIKRALSRLVEHNKIISIYKGFYIIIPPAYKRMKVLPPIMFVDSLMTFLGRPYYVSLLSAAAIHGAAHQQPQISYVCTTFPSLRATKKKGIAVKYISKRKFPKEYIIQKKTDSGYVNVSSPILTCVDIINYNKTIGGLNRAATIINELSEVINVEDINRGILNIGGKTDLQRLGYIWEYEVSRLELANELFFLLKELQTNLRSCKLNNSKENKDGKIQNRWKINVNTTIEIDE